MKIISPRLHAVIDYLLILFLLAAPALFGFSGYIASFTYALAGIHFLLTITTDFNGGIIRIIPMPIHGLIELLVGFALIALAYKLFIDYEPARLFYIIIGLVILAVWLLSDYNYKPSRITIFRD